MDKDKLAEDIIDVEPKLVEDAKPAKSAFARNWRWTVPPFALLIVGLVGGGWLYRDWIGNYLPSDRVTALGQRVDALEAGNRDTIKRIDAVVALTEELKTKLTAAQTAADKSVKQNADAVAAVAGLRQDVDKLQAGLAEAQARLAVPDKATGPVVAVAPPPKPDAVDFAPALASLKMAIASGGGFAAQLAPLAKAKPAAPGLDVLNAESVTGVPTAQQLAQELEAMKPTLSRPQPAASDDNSYWGLAKAYVGRIIRVRSASDVDPGAIASKAAGLAGSGDLQQAMDMVAKVDNAALKTWAAKASRRIKLDQACEQFSASVLKG